MLEIARAEYPSVYFIGTEPLAHSNVELPPPPVLMNRKQRRAQQARNRSKLIR